MPAAAGETRGDDLLVEANKFGETAVAGDLLHIGPDFGRRSIFARPIVIGLKREFILTREDIDEKTREGIVSPGPPDLAGLFVNGEVDTGAF